jgi:hypothetical protein
VSTDALVGVIVAVPAWLTCTIGAVKTSAVNKRSRSFIALLLILSRLLYKHCYACLYYILVYSFPIVFYAIIINIFVLAERSKIQEIRCAGSPLGS